MRIDKLIIQNFRCFDSLTLDLHPEFNVLIGENGAGKTAILEALAVAAGTWVLGTNGNTPRSIRSGDIRLVSRDVAGSTTFEPQAPVRVSAEGQFRERPITWMRTLDVPHMTWGETGPFAIGEPISRAEDLVRAGAEITIPLIAYYGAGRSWLSRENTYSENPSLTQRELSRFEGYHDALSAQTNGRELNRWLEYQDRVAYQEKQEAPVFRAVLDAMRGMVEGAADVRFDAKRLEVVVEFKSGEVHPFAQLSDGQRNMLALAGDMAMRMARLNPQFGADVLKQTPGVVLIDELDLHLHPRWQRHVVADLRRTFPLVQFVTTTHSPQILSEVQPECVTVLEKEGERIVAYKANQSYGLDTNGVLQRLMDDPGRPVPVRDKIDEADDAIEEGDLDQARTIAQELRRLLHGEDPEVVRIDTSIYALEALADAVD